MPAAAEIQPGTGRLLETLENSGILITLNHEEECFNGMQWTVPLAWFPT